MKINGARGGGGGTIVSAADEIDGKEVPIASGETKEREHSTRSFACLSFPQLMMTYGERIGGSRSREMMPPGTIASN